MGGMPQEVGCSWFLEEAWKKDGFCESEFLGTIRTGFSFTGKHWRFQREENIIGTGKVENKAGIWLRLTKQGS